VEEIKYANIIVGKKVVENVEEVKYVNTIEEKIYVKNAGEVKYAYIVYVNHYVNCAEGINYVNLLGVKHKLDQNMKATVLTVLYISSLIGPIREIIKQKKKRPLIILLKNILNLLGWLIKKFKMGVQENALIFF
jgi:hypothetical protein